MPWRPEYIAAFAVYIALCLANYWEMPLKSKLEIYALAVCFMSVICLVVSFGIAGYSIVEMFKPELTMASYTYERYQTNDNYWEGRRSSRNSETKEIRPSEEVLSKQRRDEYSAALRGKERSGFQALIKSLMFILAGGITLLVHWQIANRSRVP